MLDTLGDVYDTQLGPTPTSVALTGLGVTLDDDADGIYWIVLTDMTPPGDGATSIEWSIAADDTGTGVPGQWNGAAGIVYPNSTYTPYMMCVSDDGPAGGACSVPEPASLGVLGLGLAGLGVLRRRRRSA